MRKMSFAFILGGKTLMQKIAPAVPGKSACGLFSFSFPLIKRSCPWLEYGVSGMLMLMLMLKPIVHHSL